MTASDQDPALPETIAAIERLVANHRQFLAFLQSRVGSGSCATHGCLDCTCGSPDRGCG
ncbi:MAG: hypothetical protein JNL82_08345 [Myxococcales bacterium]|nr:hypothetical protein [Myxococcales bacterium]